MNIFRDVLTHMTVANLRLSTVIFQLVQLIFSKKEHV